MITTESILHITTKPVFVLTKTSLMAMIFINGVSYRLVPIMLLKLTIIYFGAMLQNSI